MTRPKPKTKVWLGLALVVLLAPVGFVAGGVMAAWTVTEMGLAAAGIAVGYMVIGAGLAMAAGLLLAVALPRGRLVTAVKTAAVALLLAAAVVAARGWWLHQKNAAARAEVEALQPAPPKPSLPPPDLLSAPPPPPADQPVAGPPSSEMWRHSTIASVGLPATGRTPGVAFYYAPRARLPLVRDAAYYYGLMPRAQSSRPCGGARVPSLFGEEARLDLGTLTLDAVERAARANCETALTAHGQGYARPAALSNF